MKRRFRWLPTFLGANVLSILCMAVGCNLGSDENSLADARRGFETTIVARIDYFGPPDVPPAEAPFELIRYDAPVGKCAAYLSKDPGDGQRHPAMVWITGGDFNSIGDVWSPNPRDNDQSVSAFQQAGIIMMFPSLRGGNDNPGKRESFFGEVDDILAATDHLENLDYVDSSQIYLGGHSTGGTIVMLVGQCSDRYQAIFSLGPVANPMNYGNDYVNGERHDWSEIKLRAPIEWLNSVKSTMVVVEGAERGNWSQAKAMSDKNTNPNIQFFKVPGHDHFSVIAPFAELVARQIVAGEVKLDQAMMDGLQ